MSIEAEKLLEWYEKKKRPLPWRKTTDPYHIWISEVMAQQTRVETVVDYYHRFIEAFPTVEHLAQADLDEVMHQWQGLGYYGRGKRLWQAAKVIAEEYDGHFPRSHEAILALPGVGPYTAGAISSIAFNERRPAVDGNVFRVIARFRGLDHDIAQARTRKIFEEVVLEILPEDARGFNQALMELGALVCKPTNPLCAACPWKEVCVAKREQRVETLPVKTKKKKPLLEEWKVLVLKNDRGEILFVKRPQEGLLADLWGLPMGADSEKTFKERLEEDLGLAIESLQPSGYVEHLFTHRRWYMKRFVGRASVTTPIDDPEVCWMDPKDLPTLGIPTAFKKVLTL